VSRSFEGKEARKFYRHPTSVVEEDAVIGEGTKIWHFAHVRTGARIGKKCVIGKDVYIDSDVEIGDGVHIQNGVSVYNGVVLEDNVFVGPNVSFTNDMYPRAGATYWKAIPTRVCKHASIGAGATIICGITIGRYAMVGASSCVTNNVDPFILVSGTPARKMGTVCRCGEPAKELLDGYFCKRCNQTFDPRVAGL